MKDKKFRIEMFAYYDHSGISHHLKEMASKGWLIDKITNVGWTYRRIEPKEIEFAVSYYPKASVWDAEPSEQQKGMHDFCAHTGWNLACTSAQMQIFYNEQENPIPIETEAVLELQSIHKTAKKTHLLANGFILIMVVFQLFMQLFLFSNPIDFFSNSITLFSITCFFVAFLITSQQLLSYFLWYRKAKVAAVQGVFLETPNTRKIQRIIWFSFLILLFITFTGSSSTRSNISIVKIIFIIFSVGILFFCLNMILQFLKRINLPKFFKIIFYFVAVYFITFGLLDFVLKLEITRSIFENKKATYEVNGSTYPLYNDDIPLDVTDLLGLDKEMFNNMNTMEESVFLKREFVFQYPRVGAKKENDIRTYRYTVVTVKMSIFFDMVKEQLLAEVAPDFEYREMEVIQEDIHVYQVHSKRRSYESYLLHNDTIFLSISFDEPPTEDQFEIIINKIFRNK